MKIKNRIETLINTIIRMMVIYNSMASVVRLRIIYGMFEHDINTYKPDFSHLLELILESIL